MISFLLGALAYAACTFDARPDRLDEALQAAEAAYVSLEVAAFQKAMTEVDFMVPCLVAPVAPDVAMRLHRVRGLGRFIDGDPAGAEASLRAARYGAPDYVFPTDVLPEGFELRVLYEELPDLPAETLRIPRARGGEVYVDGVVRRERPADAAALVQVFAGDEPVARYVAAGDPLPYYPGVDRTSTALLWSAGGTAVVAAAFYGGAWAAHGALDRAVDEDDLRARQATTNGLVTASAVLTGAALTQAAVALRRRRR